jgi:hypothetical protein
MDLAEKWKSICGEPEYIDRASLQPIAMDDERTYFACPWCKDDGHYAVSARMPELVLRCHTSGKMAFLTRAEILPVIRDEEAKFLKLLDKFQNKLPVSMSAQEAFGLMTSKGAPLELIEDRCEDVAELQRMLDEHRALSRSASKFAKEIF